MMNRVSHPILYQALQSRMLRTGFAACLSFVVIILTGVGVRGQGGAPAERYVDKQYGYSFAIPSGWKRKVDLPKPFVAYVGPNDRGFTPNFSVYVESAQGKSLGQYTATARSAIAKTNGIKIESERTARLGGAAAESMQYFVDTAGHPGCRVRQFLAVRSGRGYLLTFTATPEQGKRWQPTFDRVAASFHWER